MSTIHMRDRQVGKLVRTFLTHIEATQRDLAQAIGMDAATMSRALSGQRRWTLDELDAMAAFFDIPVTSFFTEPEGLPPRPDTPRTQHTRAPRCTEAPYLVAA